jgi:hypothetical protein
MKSLLELSRETSQNETDLFKLKGRLVALHGERKRISSEIEEIERRDFEQRLHLSHVKEIFRLAKTQFSRLRALPEQTLTDADVKELDKWIGRVKSTDGLLDIQKALLELDKYSPSDIKLNLYALVQKIIIEGPYKKGARK